MPLDRIKPNKKNEFLLRVDSTTTEGIFTVYDLTAYLPEWEGYERKSRLKNVNHSIVGKVFTVHIIDFYEELNPSQAKQLAIGYFNGNLDYYRLD